MSEEKEKARGIILAIMNLWNLSIHDIYDDEKTELLIIPKKETKSEVEA